MCQLRVSPALGRMFIGPPFGGSWHFWGSGSAGSYANRRRLRGVVSLSHAIASLEAEKSPALAAPDRRERARQWAPRAAYVPPDSRTAQFACPRAAG